jgi:hypothetical protein
MKNLLWDRWDDTDIENNPHLLRTCVECAYFGDECVYIERVTIEEYGNSPACAIFQENV